MRRLSASGRRKADSRNPFACMDCETTITGVVYFADGMTCKPRCERCYRELLAADERAYHAVYPRALGGMPPRELHEFVLPRVERCEVCGREIAFARYRRSRRTLCSFSCERELRNAPRRVVHPPRRCGRCSAEYIPRRVDSRYCTNTCRQRAYRERKRTAA
jgi:hypothetical protein